MKKLSVLFTFAVFTVSSFSQETGDALRPFSATIVSTISAGDHPFQLRGRYAQASDGSNAYISENDPPANDEGLRGEFSFLLNMRKNLYIHTNSLIRAAVVTPLVDGEDLKKIQPRHSCKWLADGTWRRVGEGESKIKGIRVIEVIDEETQTPELTRLITLWVAPDLNCFQMKRTHVKNGVMVAEDIVESLDLKEPTSAIFDVPLGYSNVRPAEFERLYRVKFPGKQIYSDDMVMRFESQYQRAIDKAGARPLPSHKK